MADKRPPISKMLTGEFLQGLSENSPIEENAEIEDKEYVKFPDGETIKAKGDKHSGGGIDVHLPNSTKVLSDQLSIDGKEAKKLTKEYGFKVTSKDTYAKVLDKYVKEIGLQKIYDEQSELFEGLKKTMDETDDKGTLNINKQYLSGKISEIEKKKEAKEKVKGEFFERLFLMQENGKPKQSRKEQLFAKGGMTNSDFKGLIKKYGITEEQGLYMMEHGKVMPEYPDGGVHGVPRTKADVEKQRNDGTITQYQADQYLAGLIKEAGGPTTLEEVELLHETGNLSNDEYTKVREGVKVSQAKGNIQFSTSTGRHLFSNEEAYQREKQSKSEGAFGKITKDDIPVVLTHLYKNFPDIVAEDDVFGVTFDGEGNISFNEDLDFSKVLPQVKRFQEKANDRMKTSAQVVIDNPKNFSTDEIEAAKSFVENQTFDESLARGLDSKQGQFTSGRFNLGVDVVTPEELKDLEARGIYTVNQLKDGVENGDIKLSDSSVDRLDKIKDLQVEGSDFTLNPVQDPEKPAVTPEEKKKEPVVAPTDDLVDDIKLPKKDIPHRFAAPDQTPLPPSPLAAHLRGDLDLQRIDPVRVGIENQKQQADEALQFATAQLDHLPPAQKAAALAGLHANYQKGINDSIHKADVVNAQNQASAELFNIGQAAREEQAELGNLLSFEQRQFTAKAKTEEEYRRYFDELRRINTNDFRNQQNLNLLEGLTPDYDLDFSGAGVNYNPNSEFQLQDNTNLQGTGINGY